MLAHRHWSNILNERRRQKCADPLIRIIASALCKLRGASERLRWRQSLSYQERQALTEAQRHLNTANHCLVRQLRALSRLGRHTSNVELAEALLKTMMQTHQLIVEGKQRLELRPGWSAPKRGGSSKLNKSGPRACVDTDEEATTLLRSKRLQPKSDDNASVLSRAYPGRCW
jgi:hypothetical protein